MAKNNLHFETAKSVDARRLAEIRVEAMRPSLQAVGRFDPERAKYRFLSSFQASDTKIIYVDEDIAGFFVVRKKSDHLYLGHLYLIAIFQGRGIGHQIIDDLKREAAIVSMPIRLLALNGSLSNEFYLSCGFEFVSTDQIDTLYQWSPDKKH